MKLMGRPRTFDEVEVLRRATRLFGREGFDAASVDAILAALEMNRASFYKIFGSKHGLARAALRQVCERALDHDVDSDSKDFVLISLLEMSNPDEELSHLITRATALCFSDDPTQIGQHLLARFNRKKA